MSLKLHSTPTYSFGKKILLGLIVFTYLIGTFQDTAFELIHAMSHQFSGNHSYRSHQNDQHTADHEHQVLDLSKTAIEEQTDSPFSPENSIKVSFDKIPQICAETSILTPFLNHKINNHQPTNFQLPSSPFLSQNSPPPQV